MDGQVRLSELIAPVFYDLHRDFQRGGHAEYWLKGGRGSAKSSFASVEVVLSILKNPDVNAVVYRKVAATLRESVYEQIGWAIGRMGLSEWFRFRLAPLEIDYLPTGQRILFRGADDPGKSKSIKLAKGYFGLLWFEELAEFSGMDAVRSIKASVLRGGPSRVIYTYNPPRSPRCWVNEEARVVRSDRRVHESSYLDLPPQWLGEAFLSEAEQLRRVNERAYRNMYLGEITGSGGQVFDNVALRRLSDEELDGRAYCGLDFGFAADPDAFIRAVYDRKRGVLCVADEFRGVRTTAERLAGEVSRRAGGEVVRCDCADPRMIAQLRERGVMAVPVKKGAGSVAVGVRWLQEQSRIVIDPERCPNAAREFVGYEYAADGNGGFLPELPDRDNHWIDALRYAMEPVIRGRSARTVDRASVGME